MTFVFRGSGKMDVDEFVEQFRQQLADGGHPEFVNVLREAI